MKSILKRVLAIGASFIMVAGIGVGSASPAFAYGADPGTIGNGWARVLIQTTNAAVTQCRSDIGGRYGFAPLFRGKVVVGSLTAFGPTLPRGHVLDSTVAGSASGVTNGSWFCQNLG